jgi:hypothetical protein
MVTDARCIRPRNRTIIGHNGRRRHGAFPANIDHSSLDGSNGFKLSGVAERDLSGHSVASAGDVNGDGFADLVVGAPRADPHGTWSGAS